MSKLIVIHKFDSTAWPPLHNMEISSLSYGFPPTGKRDRIDGDTDNLSLLKQNSEKDSLSLKAESMEKFDSFG